MKTTTTKNFPFSMKTNKKSANKSELVFNIHLTVLHLHLIQLILLMRGVTVHKFLPLQGESHLLPVLMGGGWQRAVRDLGVVALIGEVAEPLLLRQTASVLATTEPSQQADSKPKITIHYDPCTCWSGESSPSGLAV